MFARSQKLKKSITIFILVVILAANFSFIKPADAFLGIADQSFNFTMGDIPRLLGNIAEKIGKQLLEQMRKQMIRMLTNDIVNWVQNGGRPRFVQNFGAEVKKAGDRAGGQVLQDLFFAKGVNICSPFRASVNVMVQKVVFPPDEGEGLGFQCTLGDIKKNLGDSLQSFADDFTGKEGGGWKTWFQLHETQNTLAGSYLAASKLTVAKVNKEAQTAKAEITLGAGFLDQKLCAKAQKIGVVVGDVQALVIPPIFTATLQRTTNKTVNPEVQKLQKFLNEKVPEGLNVGAGLEVDGIFGQKTEATVKFFQKIWGLEEDGVVGKETRDALNQAAYLASPAASSLADVAGAVNYETQTKSYEDRKGGGVAMDQLPQDEKCIETVVATPGRIIGDQLSGVLKSTGIDRIINAQELAQILNAVINAVVNRVAKEGLSLMNSGKGSWSSPTRGTYKDHLGQRSTDIPGMEGTKAAELLNQIIEFRTKAQELKNALDKLTIRSDEANKTSFTNRLNEIFGDEDETPEFRHYKFDFEKASGDRKCAGGVNRAIDNCMFASTGKSDYDLRQEKFTPGPYIANQIFYSKLAEKWAKVETALSLLTVSPDSCEVRDIEFMLDPNPDALPFTDGNRNEFKMPRGKEKNYIEELNAASKDIASDWLTTTLPYLQSQAEIQRSQYQQLADSYAGLIEGLAAKKELAQADVRYASSTTPALIFYASLLMDYDRSGRQFKLIAATQTYQTALNANDEKIIDSTKKTLLAAQANTRADWLRVQEFYQSKEVGYVVTEDDNKNNPTIPKDTIIAQKMKDDALKKMGTIDKANELMENSLSSNQARLLVPNEETGLSDERMTLLSNLSIGNIIYVRKGERIPVDGIVYFGKSRVDESATGGAPDQEKLKDDSVAAGSINLGSPNLDSSLQIKVTSIPNDPTYLGLTPSQAVAQAKNLDIEQLLNELEQRDARVSKAQNETSNLLGQFETNQDERFRLGLEGGDSEWEKYFKNRFQYAFVSWIYDYFGRGRFGCIDTIAAQNQYNAAPNEATIDYDYTNSFGGFGSPRKEITIRSGGIITIKNIRTTPILVQHNNTPAETIYGGTSQEYTLSGTADHIFLAKMQGDLSPAKDQLTVKLVSQP